MKRLAQFYQAWYTPFGDAILRVGNVHRYAVQSGVVVDYKFRNKKHG